MKKVAIFRFRVANATSVCFDDDIQSPWYQKRLEELDSEDYMEVTLNDFLSKVKNPKIQVTPITVQRHNNGRSDTVDLFYTIEYEE